jgi:predicted CXXCH cytochrome family protein
MRRGRLFPEPPTIYHEESAWQRQAMGTPMGINRDRSAGAATAGPTGPCLFRRWLGIPSVLVLLLACAAPAAENPAPLPPAEHRPLLVREGTIESKRGYVTSDQCRLCHTAQYESWHSSYHRTMTQVVTAQSVIADFEGVALGPPEKRYRLERRGDAFWVELPAAATSANDIESAPANPAAETSSRWRRIVQSTGSHHYQLYWYPTGAGRELNMLPYVFLRDERRWAPRDAVFLQPPDWTTEKIVWNHQCLPCHSTDGQPGYLPGEPVAPGSKSPDTRVAEMGIACEMCHGPGEKHVEANRSGGGKAAPAPAIVHPAKLPAPRAAQICGQCHSVNVPYRPQDWVDYLLDGPRFRPGQDLGQSRYIVDDKTLSRSPLIEQWLGGHQKNLDDWFWPDGVVRVTGREYNGLLRSPCFAGGNFSCLSCHSPHASDPDDQLKPGMRGDQACLQCHRDLSQRITAHTHHTAESSGSRCYNCHMPHTTYGLLKASRSHTIESPSVRATLASGRPNACNLCHLDRTLAWTAQRLSDWYGQPQVEVQGADAAIAAAPLALLKGDAGLRALYAWSMGWPAAQQASGQQWLAPFLTQTLTDPYDVVRYIAGRSLRTLNGFETFRYDFVSPPGQREQAAAEALRQWNETRQREGEPRQRESEPRPAAISETNRRLLLNADGSLNTAMLQSLLEQRDNHPMLLGE